MTIPDAVVAQIALIRCDFFPGSGVGHLKRCNALGIELNKLGFEAELVLDTNSDALPVNVGLPIESLLVAEFDEIDDANRLVELAKAKGTALIVVDSYRISARWIDIVKRAGFFTVILDEQKIGSDADIRIDYTPGASKTSGPALSLLGEPYFLTTVERAYRSRAQCKRVIAHAGGNGDYELGSCIYEELVSFVAKNNLSLDWLVTGHESLLALEKLRLLRKDHGFLQWSNSENAVWNPYDLIVGPASTSFYESILQGVLPITFPISSSQTSCRKPFVSIGHMLHLTTEEVWDRAQIVSTFELALMHFNIFLESLGKFSANLDGRGAGRAARMIVKILAGNPEQTTTTDERVQSGVDTIRPCDMRDALSWLEARNAPAALGVSSDPRHHIQWSEHLRWWMNPDIEKFVVENHQGPQAFFWHQATTVDEKRYLIGGWFPSIDGDASFSPIAVLMQWQIDYCREKYPHHKWVAIIHQSNRTVLALNKYHGFSDASDEVRSAAANLFPRFSEDFVVLQRSTSQ